MITWGLLVIAWSLVVPFLMGRFFGHRDHARGFEEGLNHAKRIHGSLVTGGLIPLLVAKGATPAEIKVALNAVPMISCGRPSCKACAKLVETRPN